MSFSVLKLPFPVLELPFPVFELPFPVLELPFPILELPFLPILIYKILENREYKSPLVHRCNLMKHGF